DVNNAPPGDARQVDLSAQDLQLSLKFDRPAAANKQTRQVPEPQALADYAARVGAERRNFRRYVIREQQRELYHFDRYIITITDGEVTVRDAQGGEVPEVIEPTEQECAAIRTACTGADWPTCVRANAYDVDTLRQLVGRDALLFQFRDAKDAGMVLFVQQRKFMDDGGKIDLPWTYWSDGVWRCM